MRSVDPSETRMLLVDDKVDLQVEFKFLVRKVLPFKVERHEAVKRPEEFLLRALVKRLLYAQK